MSLRRHHFRARFGLLLLELSLATAALLLLPGVATAATGATGGRVAQNPRPQGNGYCSVAYTPASSAQASGLAEPRQKSTTGPVPPASVRPARGAMSGTQDEVLISGVPCYLWWDGCGPTAVGMVIGYYDTQGWPALVAGDAGSQTDAVDQMISSHSTGSGNQSYEDYSLPLDDPNTDSSPLPDMSTIDPAGAHFSDCVADFAQTSWSAADLYYGWTWDTDIAPGFDGYVDEVAPQYAPTSTEYDMSGALTWTLVQQQIDAGRPMVFLVDSDGDGLTDHFVTVIGYGEVNGEPEYACWDTWYQNAVRWELFRTMSSSYAWGVYSGWTFSLSPTISSFDPTSGATGANVTLNGAGFLDPSKVAFNGVAAKFTVNSATQITAIVPAGATTGKITVTTPGGTATSAASFVVSAFSGPTVTVSGADSAWHASTVELTVTAAVDPALTLTSLQDSTNGGATWSDVPGSGEVRTLPISAQGTTNVTVRVTDSAEQTASDSVIVKIDTVGPTTLAKAAKGHKGKAIALRYLVRDNLSPQAVAVTLTVRNSHGKLVKRFVLGTKPISTWCVARWTPKAKGTYRYTVTAKDLAGNRQTKSGSAKIAVK